MVSVYPIRRKDGDWEHLIIKRATVAYNWQCVTGGVDEGEEPLSTAHRELLEETGYETKKMIRYYYGDDYFIDDEPEGDQDENLLRLFLEEIDNIVYIAIIEDNTDPVIDPKEHTDWKWCDFDEAYRLIKWSIEKKGHRKIREYIERSPNL